MKERDQRNLEKPIRIAVLFSRLSGYMAACLETLRFDHGVRLMVIRIPPVENAPFDDRHFDWIDELHDRNDVDAAEMESLLSRFAPDAVYVSGWFDKEYLAVARRFKRGGVLVVAGIDRQWEGSPRQQLARLAARWYLHSAFDVLWAAGERQRQFAARLGYTGDRCWSGVYACDWERFASVYGANGVERPKAFLFVGRYVAEKGIPTLLEAFKRYRSRVERPWRLICAGAGAFRQDIQSQDGVEDVGFTQPDELPRLMSRASAFVMSSRWEPWGVAIQEAAAAGLPLICSDACGAAVHLLQDRYNGYVIEQGSACQLATAFEQMASLSASEWRTMSRRSHELSRQFTPERWAETFVSGIEHHRLRPSVSS